MKVPVLSSLILFHARQAGGGYHSFLPSGGGPRTHTVQTDVSHERPSCEYEVIQQKHVAAQEKLAWRGCNDPFLYCNAHFLIGLAGEREKTVRCQESYLEETSGLKLGRASQSAFKHWSSEETAASRLIRTASDVFGPRGDEKKWVSGGVASPLRFMSSKVTVYQL